MLIEFNQFQFKKFDEMVSKIKAHPQDYIDFDSVSDFYKADWLAAFPQGTTWFATGLDNGAEEFYAQIEYRHKKLTIHVKTGDIAIKSM